MFMYSNKLPVFFLGVPLSGFKAEHNQKFLFLGGFLMPFHGDKLAIKGTYNTDPSFSSMQKKISL